MTAVPSPRNCSSVAARACSAAACIARVRSARNFVGRRCAAPEGVPGSGDSACSSAGAGGSACAWTGAASGARIVTGASSWPWMPSPAASWGLVSTVFRRHRRTIGGVGGRRAGGELLGGLGRRLAGRRAIRAPRKPESGTGIGGCHAARSPAARSARAPSTPDADPRSGEGCGGVDWWYQRAPPVVPPESHWCRPAPARCPDVTGRSRLPWAAMTDPRSTAPAPAPTPAAQVPSPATQAPSPATPASGDPGALLGMAALPLDRLGRRMHDLRISVTDRCNFRCGYCMPAEVFGRDYAFLPRRRDPRLRGDRAARPALRRARRREAPHHRRRTDRAPRPARPRPDAGRDRRRA